MLDSHIEKGLSYLFWEPDEHAIEFSDFDFVIANTAAVETWHNFYETTSTYKSDAEMERIYNKTIFCVHEYDVEKYTNPFLNAMLPKVPKVLFDSDAGKNQWINVIPEIAERSVTLHPGIPRVRMLPLLAILADQKVEFRQKLDIPTSNPSDVVILQISSMCKHKGINELIHGFYGMFDSLSNEIIQERAWFLVLVGEDCGEDYMGEIDEVNKSLTERNSRSRIIL